MILVDSLHQYCPDATKVDGLTKHYQPAHIMITRTTGEVGNFERLPVRIRVERGGFILLTVLSLETIDKWFRERIILTATLASSKALQSWIVIVGVEENNLFNTMGDGIDSRDFVDWLTKSRLAGCQVATVVDDDEVSSLCNTINDTMINNGEVQSVYNMNLLLSSVPHCGPIAHSVIEYTGSLWAALAFLTNKDLFNTLPTSPHATEALGKGFFTREHHKEVRQFFGLEPKDYGIGLYLEE